MMILIAAALAAQATPAADLHAQHGQMPAAQHEQHDGMKTDCCEDCCKDMAKGDHDLHAGAEPKRGQ